MNNLIAYIVELNIALTTLFLLYLLIFRKDSNFGMRRVFLFFAMLISIIFPLIHVTIGNSQTGLYPAIISLDEVLVQVRTGILSAGSSIDMIQGLTIAYLAIVALFILRLISMLFRILFYAVTSKKGSFGKSLLLIPASIVLFLFISCNNKGAAEVTENINVPAIEKQIFYVVEEMPKWHDGSEMLMELRKFIATKLIYPQEAKENGAQGKVFVHFIVTETGKIEIPSPSQLPPEKTSSGEIEDVVVVAYKAINADNAAPDEKYIQLLKDEAVRVIGEIPDLIPGKQRGVNVSVIFTMPITFALK